MRGQAQNRFRLSVLAGCERRCDLGTVFLQICTRTHEWLAGPGRGVNFRNLCIFIPFGWLGGNPEFLMLDGTLEPSTKKQYARKVGRCWWLNYTTATCERRERDCGVLQTTREQTGQKGTVSFVQRAIHRQLLNLFYVRAWAFLSSHATKLTSTVAVDAGISIYSSMVHVA